MENPLVDWAGFGAALFDLDGVLTPTAEIHERAWAQLFAPWGFTSADYLTYVDGRPRYDGVHAFLSARRVELPWGDPSDPPGAATVCGMGNRKNELFNEVLARDGIEPYAGSLAVLDALDAAGVPQAVVSSSRNAGQVLAVAGLAARFPVVVDGLTAVDAHLAGKPDPAMFQHAAHMLGVTPDRSIVVEDAVSGVQAGVAGGFAFVLAIDRGGNADALAAAGAHLIVGDLGDTLAPDPAERS
jgi:HAD superfamily hydrolase (TIGR01509 family)